MFAVVICLVLFMCTLTMGLCPFVVSVVMWSSLVCL